MTKEAVSLAVELQKLETGSLCERHAVKALATGANTSFLDGVYNNQATMNTYM